MAIEGDRHYKENKRTGNSNKKQDNIGDSIDVSRRLGLMLRKRAATWSS